MRLFNINKNIYRNITANSTNVTIGQSTPIDFSNNNFINKFPYVCNKNNNLFKVSESTMPQYGPTNPDWFDIVNKFSKLVLFK